MYLMMLSGRPPIDPSILILHQQLQSYNLKNNLKFQSQEQSSILDTKKQATKRLTFSQRKL